MQDTKWRDSPEFSGFIVSNEGHIAKLIKPQPNIKGYFRVFIRKVRNDERRQIRYLHRLVAQSWVANPFNKGTVNHKNMIVQDNRPSNLEWMTSTENGQHRHRCGLKRRVKSEVTIETNNEAWKALPEFNNYIISDHGRIAKILYQFPNNKGYLRVAIQKDFIRVTIYVHRIVAQAWIDNPYNLKTVNHKDYNKQNNAVSNLEWMSHADNCSNGAKSPNMPPPYYRKGIDSSNAKITEHQAIEIRTRYDRGESPTLISIDYPITVHTVCNIGKRKTWRHLAVSRSLP